MPRAGWRASAWLVTAALALLLGLVWRLYGIEGSLRQDEFGTLWVVRDGLSAVGSRVSWQAQTPFYYLLTWFPYHALGESELSLRLLSLVCAPLIALAGALVGYELGGRRVAVAAALLLWLDPFVLVRSTDARPYALAVSFVALLLAGFLRACRLGDWRGRALFALGGVGAFYSHYLLALPALGVALAYASLPSLRRRYGWRCFLADVALQLLLILPVLPQFFSLADRAYVWMLPLNLRSSARALLATLALPLAPGLWGLWRGDRERRGEARARALVLWAAALVPVAGLGLAGLVTGNGILLSPRYLAGCVVPAAVLGAQGLVLVGRREALVLGLLWLGLVGGFFVRRLDQTGSFSGIGQETWREAVAALERSAAPDALVLYRSGFLDDDLNLEGRTDAATFAPLASPGRRPPPWRIVALTDSWGGPRHDAFLRERVLPALLGRREVYLLIKSHGAYADRLEQWLAEHVRGGVASQAIPGDYRGVDVRRLTLGPAG